MIRIPANPDIGMLASMADADSRRDFRFGSKEGDFSALAEAAVRREMRWRWIKLALIGAGLIAGGWLLGHALSNVAATAWHPRAMAGAYPFIAMAIGTFIVASATPFVPGAEIGIGLILLFGAKLAFLVYVSMVAALTIAFLVGRLVPAERVAALFGYLGLARARGLALRLAPLDPSARLDLLTEKVPHRLVPMLLRHRYLAIIVLFNIPGNSVIGGGGGIAFTAGLSGLFSLPAYLAAVMVGVAPIPLALGLYEFWG